MSDHDRRDAITLLWVNDALEAHGRRRSEATSHLLDAVGTLIVDAQLKDGYDATALVQQAAQYLIDQVLSNLEGDL